jgi:cytochrome P450
VTVSERPTIDLDHHSPVYAENYFDVADELRASTCPVRWTESHGGYWVTASHADVARVARDDEFFTQNHDREGAARGGVGVQRPPGPVRVLPIESEPPFTQFVRQLCGPAFSPAGATDFQPGFTKIVTECLDAVIETGQIDFSEDLAAIATVRGTMQLIGLPEDRVPLYAKVAHETSFLAPGESGFDEAMAGIGEIQADVVSLVQNQKKDPQPGLTANLLAGEVKGQKLSDDDIVGVLMSLILGGGDTTATLTLRTLRWLAEHPEHKQRLRDDDVYFANATEEFLRVFTPNVQIFRTTVKDTELSGQPVCAGESVMMWWAAANRDPAVFPDPYEMRLDRPESNRHLAFGNGTHRCLGQHVARMEFKTLVREVLRRMPDYTIDETRVERYHTVKTIDGLVHLYASFTPGAREGTATASTTARDGAA